MSQYITKLFEKSPFDKSDYIRDVQIICESDTGKPVAHLDSPYNWEGEEFEESELDFTWQSKKAKHLVVGDTVTFGEGLTFCGIVEKIVPENEEELSWDDMFYLINCKDELSDNILESLRDLAKEINPNQQIKRKDLQCKSWLSAKVKGDNVKWRQLEKKWNEFYDADTHSKKDIINWWKLNVKPKDY